MRESRQTTLVCKDSERIVGKPEVIDGPRGQVLISTDCVFDASLVPETCLEFLSLPMCLRDSIRQAKADMRHGASCPTISMAPVLAITCLVARIWLFTVL